MTTWIALGAIVAMALVVMGLGSVVWFRLRGYRSGVARGAEAGPAFELGRYEPLARLLANDDVEFLRRQSSCPEIAARWKRARVRIARLYLSDLAADFRYLHAEARAQVAESPEQQSELVGVLMRQQLTFWRVMADTELRLTLSWLGLERLGLDRMGFVKIDARRLMEAIAAMQAEITRTTAPLPA